MKKNGTLLTLAACPKNKKPAGGNADVKIKNDTGGTIWLSLSGPGTYNFSLAPGNSTITVLKGKYNYTVRGCGGASLSGTQGAEEQYGVALLVHSVIFLIVARHSPGECRATIK